MTKEHPVEADVKKKIRKALDKHGWFHWMPVAGLYGTGGVSDILALKAGIFLAIEAKHGSGAKGGTKQKPMGTPLQMNFLASVRSHGGYGHVINEENLPRLEALLVEIDKWIDRKTKA